MTLDSNPNLPRGQNVGDRFIDTANFNLIAERSARNIQFSNAFNVRSEGNLTMVDLHKKSKLDLSKNMFGITNTVFDATASKYKVTIGDGYVLDNGKKYVEYNAGTEVELTNNGENFIFADYQWNGAISIERADTLAAPTTPYTTHRTLLYKYTTAYASDSNTVELSLHNTGLIRADKFGFYAQLQSNATESPYYVRQMVWDAGTLTAIGAAFQVGEVNTVKPLKDGLIVWVSRDFDESDSSTVRYAIEYALPHGLQDYAVVWYDDTNVMGDGAGRHHAKPWRFTD